MLPFGMVIIINNAVIRPNTLLTTSLTLQPTICAIIIHANMPIIPPMEWAEFIRPTEKPGNPLLPCFAIWITAELKKKASQNPYMKRNQISSDDDKTDTLRGADIEEIENTTITDTGRN